MAPLFCAATFPPELSLSDYTDILGAPYQIISRHSPPSPHQSYFPEKKEGFLSRFNFYFFQLLQIGDDYEPYIACYIRHWQLRFLLGHNIDDQQHEA